MFDDRIQIGITVVDENANAVVAGVAGSSVAFGDSRGFADSLVEWVNDNGGLAGRRLEPIFYEMESAEVVTDESGPSQEACTAWTQDTKVFAAIIPVGAQTANYVACLAENNTPVITETISLDSQQFGRWSDFYYYPAGLLLDRMHRVYADGLADQGFFPSGSKVGLLTLDLPAHRRVSSDVVRPTLTARGLDVVDEIFFTAPTGLGDPWEAYVLRFKTAGIDRILHIGGDGWAYLQFANAAEPQDYHPHYGMNSTTAMSTLEGLLPPSQLRGSMGVSWFPVNDVNAANDPSPINDANVLCLEILEGHDLESRQSLNWAVSYCSTIMLLKRAVDAAPALNPAGLKAAVEALGSGWDSAKTFGTRFGPGRHDGVTLLGPVAYDDNCSCFRYTGPPQAAD